MKKERRRLEDRLRPYKHLSLLVDAWVRRQDRNPNRNFNWKALLRHHNVSCPYHIAQPFVESSRCPDFGIAKEFGVVLAEHNKAHNNAKSDAELLKEFLNHEDAMQIIKQFFKAKSSTTHPNGRLPI